MISDDMFSNVNNNIVIKRDNIRNGFDTDFRNGKDYLDKIGNSLIKEKLNINVDSFVEPFDEDDTNAYLYKTLNNYSDEPLTFEGENAAGYNPATYGNMRLNMQYKGSKTGSLPRFYKDFNSNFKREKIDKTYVELGDIRKEMGSRNTKFQKITYNNDGYNNTLSGERDMRDVIKDRRKFDGLLKERFRTITRDDDDIGGYNRTRQLNYKPIDNNMIENDMQESDVSFNTKLSAIALHYSPYSSTVKNTIQDLRQRNQLYAQNRQYSTKSDPVDRSNYISDVRLKNSLMQFFANKYNNSSDRTMKQEHFDTTTRMNNSLIASQMNSVNVNAYTNIPSEVSMRQSALREDMAKIFRNNIGKSERLEQSDSRKINPISEKMSNLTKVNIKNAANAIRSGEVYTKSKDSLMIGNTGLNVSSLVLTQDGYAIPMMKDISKTVNNTVLNHEKYTNLDSDMSMLYDINTEKMGLNPAQLNISNKTSLDRSYIEDANKKNLRTSDTFINKHVSTAKKVRFMPSVSHDNPLNETF